MTKLNDKLGARAVQSAFIYTVGEHSCPELGNWPEEGSVLNMPELQFL
jgi:hypothetical protein